MPSFVCTASIYVDDVRTPFHATEAVELLNRNNDATYYKVEIRLQDHPDEQWEEVTPPNGP